MHYFLVFVNDSVASMSVYAYHDRTNSGQLE